MIGRKEGVKDREGGGSDREDMSYQIAAWSCVHHKTYAHIRTHP